MLTTVATWTLTRDASLDLADHFRANDKKVTLVPFES